MEEISTGPREIVSSVLVVLRDEALASASSKGSKVGIPSMLIRIPDTSMWEDEE